MVCVGCPEVVRLLFYVRNSRAFSLVQLLVSLLIAGVVVASALMLGFRFISQTADAGERAQLLNRSKQGLQIFAKDLNQAIRIDGLTRVARPGIAPYDSNTNSVANPRDDSQSIEHITLYVHNVPGFSLRTNEDFNFDSTTGSFTFTANVNFDPPELYDSDPNNDPPQSQLQIREFFSQAHNTHSLYSLRSLEDLDVFDKVATVLNSGVLTFEFSNEARGLEVLDSIIDLGEGPFSVRTVERIDYFIPEEGPDANKLIREVRRTDNLSSEPLSRTVIALKAQGLRLDYAFGPNEGDISGSPLLEIQGQYFRHLDLANDAIIGLDPVSWENIVEVRAFLDMASLEPANSGSNEDVFYDTIEISGKEHWLLRDETNIRPIDYSLDKGQAIAFSGGTECHPDNPLSRCNPDCDDEEIFTNPSFGAKDWEGYARHRQTDSPAGPSNYCLCGQDPTSLAFAPPDYAANRDAIPNFQFGNQTVNERLAQCVGHFGWASAWKHKDPRAWLINDGLNQASDFYVNNTPGQYEYNEVAFDGLVTDLEAYMNSANKAQVAADFHRLRCRYQETMQARARTLTGNSALDIGEMRCQCLIRDKDINGDATSTTVTQRRYDRMCSPTFCPDNVEDDNGTYRYAIHNDPSEQQLSESIAGLCECVHTQDPARFSQDSSSWRQSDFRQNILPGDPLHDPANIGSAHLPPGYTLPPTDQKFLSNSAVSIVVNKMGGGTFTAACDSVQCNTTEMTPSVGCCTANNSYGENGDVTGVFSGHDDYCSSQCGYLGGDERAESRHVITQTFWDEELPLSCGGTSGDENYNDGVVDGSGN